MPFTKNSFFNTTWVTVITSLIAIALAITALLGWIFDYDLLKSFNPAWATMKVNTALGIIFSASSLLLFAAGKKKLPFVLGAIVFLLGAISLCEYLFHWNAHIDELFFAEAKAILTAYPGRMAKATTWGFVLLSMSLLLYSSDKKILIRISEWFAILVLLFSITTFVTYFYSASQFFKSIQLSSVSLPAVISGLLISVGILFSRPDNGMLSVFNKPTIAAKLGLRGILIAMILIILLGWLRLKSEEVNIFDKAIGLSIMAIVFAIIFILMTWYSTKKLNMAEEQLRKSEIRYRSLIEQASDYIMVTDLKGNFVDVNSSLCKMFGYSRDELLQMNVSAVIDPEQLKTDPLRFDLLLNGQAILRERRMICKDGTIIEVQANIKMLPDGRVLAVVRDITERKKVEQQLGESYQAIRRLTDHLQTIREEERKSIAREIHDDLGQQLAVLKMDASWMKTALSASDDTVKQKVESLFDLADDMVKTVRRISSDLRPSLLDDMGLATAIEWHLKEFEKSFGISTEFIGSDHESELTDAVKTGLFRVFQASVANVAHHAGAKKIKVGLKQQNGKFIMHIEDDGVGFEKDNIAGQKTLGILGMKERCAMLGGTYEINSTPGKGTVVLVTIPSGK